MASQTTSDQNNPYQGPMQPYPGLEGWAQELYLPKCRIKLHLYDTGEEEQPPLLFIHGLGDEADSWRHVLPAITSSARCLALDLPGYGRSDKPPIRYTIPFFADTILDLLDHLSIAKATLVGHSAGSIIAQHFAVKHPDRVDRLVFISGPLVSKSNHIDPGSLMFLTPGLGEMIYNRLRKDPQAAYQTLYAYYHRLEDLPEADRSFLFQRVNQRVWSDGQRRGFLSTFRNMASWLMKQPRALPISLQDWPFPTLILWGEKDRVNPVENAQILRQMLPSARLMTIPDAGHNVQQEKGFEVAQAIINFIGSGEI